jgi:cysteine-rich repeat protein
MSFRAITLLVLTLLVGVHTQECGDGVIQAPESCDDGNLYNSDGCDVDCNLEDLTSTVWLCKNTPMLRTKCCSTLVHPVTKAHVCSCDVRELGVGYTINADCSTRDIDECNEANGGCSQHAVCINYDARADDNPAHVTHMCSCPTGTVGDGIHIDCVKS